MSRALLHRSIDIAKELGGAAAYIDFLLLKITVHNQSAFGLVIYTADSVRGLFIPGYLVHHLLTDHDLA